MAILKRNYENLVKPKLELIESWFRRGISVADICDNIGVSRSAFDKWVNKYPELRQAVESGREVSDLKVENAMFKRAIGYSYWEITKERKMIKKIDPETGDEKIIHVMIPTKKVLKHVIPDVNAQQYWLENRMSNQWRRKPKDELDENETNSQILSIVALLTNPQEERKIGDEEN